MQLFITTTATAAILGWTSADYRALRRCLKPALPVQRGHHSGRGRTPDFTELSATLRWLDAILPNGLSPYHVQRLTDHAVPLN